jgi:hypothetical protein
MFSAINALLLRPMPYMEDQDRLVAIAEFFARNPDQNVGVAFPDYLEWKKNVITLEGIAAIQEAIGRKPKGHDFVIDRKHNRPAVQRHMSVTGG